jgi:DNA-binding transcriptional regulator YiaG
MTGDSLLSGLAGAQALPNPDDRVRMRKALGIRQIDLARTIGVSAQTVWAWERGKSEPTGEHRRRYAALLSEIRERLDGGGTP